MKLRTRLFCQLALAAPLLLLSACSSSDTMDAHLRPPESFSNGKGYSFDLRVPQGYQSFPSGTTGDFKWHGETYKGKGKFSQIRQLRVRAFAAPEKATAEQESKRVLDEMSTRDYKGFRVTRQENVTLGTMGNIEGTPFLRTAYAFDDKVYQDKVADVGPGTGFLYTAVDEGTLVLIDADELDGGNPEKHLILDAAARSFFSMNRIPK